jgi:hypothetical protein
MRSTACVIQNPKRSRTLYLRSPTFTMKPTTKGRWYVWIFCYCLWSTLHSILKPAHSSPPVHLDIPFSAFFNFIELVFGPLLCAWILLWLIRGTSNWIERVILILGASYFALSVISAVHRFGFAFYVSPQISRWTFLAATVLLGYRTDQVLKYQDKRIETISCSTPS